MLAATSPEGASAAEPTTWGDEYEVARASHIGDYDIATHGKEAIVVWQNAEGTVVDILARTYDGMAWSDPVKVNTEPYLQGQSEPAVAMDASGAHVVWTDGGDGDTDIYYRLYDGTMWWPEVEVSHDVNVENQFAPDVAVDGGTAHIVYAAWPGRDLGVFYRSFDGEAWGPEMELSAPSGGDRQMYPSVAASGGRVHAVWEADTNLGMDVFYRCHDGVGWQPAIKMNGAPMQMDHVYPVVAATGDRALVSWTSDYSNLVYRMQNGTGWGPASHLMENTGQSGAAWPSVAAESDRLIMAYMNWTVTTSGICIVSDAGAGWTRPDEVPAATGPGNDELPSLAVSGGRAHVIDNRATIDEARLWYRGGVMDASPPSSSAGPLPEWATGGSVAVPWTATDDYGLASVKLLVSHSGDGVLWMRWTERATMVASGTSDSGTFRLDGFGDGYYRFATVAKDLFGNVEAMPATFDAEVACDSTPPTGSIRLNDGAHYTPSREVVIHVAWEETMVGYGPTDDEYAPIEIRLSNDGFLDTETWHRLSSSGHENWTLGSGDTTWTVWAQLRNPAGLVSETLVDDIVQDSTPPSASLVINGGAARTTSSNVTLSIAYADLMSGVIYMRLSNDDVWDFVTWDTPVVARAWQLAPGDGLKTVYLRVHDRVGHVTSVNDTIVLDATAPAVGTITPTDDASTVKVDAPVVITFSEPMDRDATERAFQMTEGAALVGGAFAWSADGMTLTFTPAGKLEKGSTYTVVVSSRASDMAGNALGDEASSRFTVEGAREGSTAGGPSAASVIGAFVLAFIALVIAIVAYMRKTV